MSTNPSHDQNYPIDQEHVRGKFATRIGFVLAAVGSAIGLGNIWKFPYIMGENGGGAFIVVYLLCIVLVGLPVLTLEFAIGRQGKTSPVGAYKRVAPKQYWWLNGFMGVLAGFMILSFYSAVAGWVLKYFVDGARSGFVQFESAEASGDHFMSLIAGTEKIDLGTTDGEDDVLTYTITAPKTGRYYITIGASGDVPEGGYQVAYAPGETAPPLMEGEETAASAEEEQDTTSFHSAVRLAPNRSETRYLTEGDTDYFFFRGDEGSVYTLSAMPLANDQGPSLAGLSLNLYDRSPAMTPIFYQFIVMLLTVMIIFFGIEAGIERMAKILMPVLFALLIAVVIRSLTLRESVGTPADGVAFMLWPDFSKLTARGFLEALGHAFFTLSLGMGAMMTYASYVDKDVHLAKTATTVCVFDTIIALLAGLAIFPAVFTFGHDPAGGPSLLFITLPQVFAEMPLGQVFGPTFFLLVFIAALTSTISILEPVVTYMVDDLRFRRHFAAFLAGGLIFVVGVPACLSVAPDAWIGDRLKIPFIGGDLMFFDFMDIVSGRFLLPIGGLIMIVFMSTVWGRAKAQAEIAGAGGDPNTPLMNLWFWVTVTIAQWGIVGILIFGIYGLVSGG